MIASRQWFKMGAAAVLGFGSDDLGMDWEGFAPDDIQQAVNLEGNDVRLSDIEVSSVNSSDLSDLEAFYDAGSTVLREPLGLLQTTLLIWGVALAKAAFRGPNPGHTEVLDDTATEFDFSFHKI